MRRLPIITGLFALISVNCTGNPPAHWPQGGAQLDIPRARWANGNLTVDITTAGQILVNGEHRLTLDRAGRVYDLEGEPVALLEPNGSVVGPDDEPLGVVGTESASLPEHSNAWASIAGNGEVTRYDDDGEPTTFGLWTGCDQTPQTRYACMLVTHLVGVQIIRLDQPPAFSWGFGFGMGVPIR